MAIRYDKKLNQEIRRTVANYNAKIKRIKGYQDSYNYITPSATTVKNVKSMVYTRGELKRKLRELQTFSKRGMENVRQLSSGAYMSEYELATLKKEARRVKGNITRRIRYMQENSPQVFGRLQARTFAQTGDVKYLNLLAKQEKLQANIETLSKDDLERYKRLVYKVGRNMEYMNSLFRENYVKMLTDLAYFTGYQVERMKLDEEQIKSIREIKDLKKAEKITNDLKLEVDDEGNVTVNKIEYLKYALSKIKNDTKFYKFFENEKAIKDIIDKYILTTGKVENYDPKNLMNSTSELFNGLINNIDDLIKPYL